MQRSRLVPKSVVGASSGSPVILVDRATQDVGVGDGPTAIGVAVSAVVRWWCGDVQVQASVRATPL
jgi:hypothetical protein